MTRNKSRHNCRTRRLSRWIAAASVALALVLLPPGVSRLEAAPASVRVAVISDTNGSYGTIGHSDAVHKAIRRIIELEPDLVISTGDMIAGQLRRGEEDKDLDAMWRAFHESVSQPLARAGIPFAITPGNHDASAYPAFSDERAHYADKWRASDSGLKFVDGRDYPFNYAFALNEVLFISLDVTTVGKLPEKDLEWLRAVLTKHRYAYREIVVFSHIPLWPVSEGRETEVTNDVRLHQLLRSSGVKLYLSGHHHAFYPGVMDGVTYVSQACLGSGPRRLLGSDTGRAPRGFTLLEIGADRIHIGSLSAPGFLAMIDWEELPKEIATQDRRMRRADLVDVAVAPLRTDQSDAAGHSQ